MTTLWRYSPLGLASVLLVATLPAHAAAARWPDGTYLGARADAYYGYVQVKVVIKGGAIRAIAVVRDNRLFAGSNAGGEQSANILALFETAKLNGLEPERYLDTVLSKINDIFVWDCESFYHGILTLAEPQHSYRKREKK